MTNSKSERILVVDDSATVRRFAQKCLEAEGYIVDVASKSSEAIELHSKNRPSIALVDLTLGEENGLDLVGAFEESDGPERLVPVLLMSGKGERAWELGHQFASLSSVISKPFDAPALLSAIGAELRRVRSARAENDQVQFLVEELSLEQSSSQGPRARILEALTEVCARSKELSKSAALQLMIDVVADPELIEGLHSSDASTAKAEPELSAHGCILGLGDTLQTLSSKNLKGILTVSRAEFEIDLYLHDGSVSFIEPRRFRLTEEDPNLFYAGHAIPSEYLIDCEAYEEGNGSLFLTLLRDGVLEVKNVARVARSLGSDLLTRCLEVPGDCSYCFSSRTEFDKSYQFIEFDAPVQEFLLTLFSRIDEWGQCFKDYCIESAVYALTDTEIDKESVGRNGKLVLAALSEARTLSEISHESKLSPFEICRELGALDSAGLLETRGEACEAR